MSRDEHLFWFHGRISREKAEELLKGDNRQDGTFLVRESNTAIGDFVLSVLYKNEVCHYQIRRHSEDAFFSIDDKIKIVHGLETLIDCYRESSNGLLTKLTQFIKKDPPPNDSRSHGTTNLLHRATKEGNQTVVSELIKCGYRNLDAKNQDGQTAIHLAALYSNEDVLKLLLNAGVNVNCMDSTGNTPLHYASRSKPGPFITTLIGAKANIQVRNINTGYVPLHEAARYGNLDAVKELLAANAPHLPRTNDGEFPIDLAKEAHHTEVVNFLSEYCVPPAKTYRHQWYHGTLDREEAVDILLEYAKCFGENNANNNVDVVECESTVVKEEDSLNNMFHNENKANIALDNSGIFLVRSSTRHGYVLTVLCQNKPKHFLIKQSQRYLYIDEGPFLPSLEHLVQHFSLFSDGLPTNLKYPVQPKPKPPLPLFSTMPKSSRKKHGVNISPSNATQTDVRSDTNSKTNSGLAEKKAKEKQDAALIFRSLKSTKRSVIIDGVKSLRKVKIRNQSKSQNDSKSGDKNKNTQYLDELHKAQALIGNITFSAVPDSAELREFNSEPKVSSSTRSASSEIRSPDRGLIGIQKSQEEIDYFTENDVVIDRERGIDQSEYFIDAPHPVQEKKASNEGYIPTVDIRKFIDTPPTRGTSKLLEESAAELRDFSDNPDKLDSIIASNQASDVGESKNSLSHQISMESETSTTSESNQTKLNYFIPHDYVKLENIIGEGEFGSVYKGYLSDKEDSENCFHYPVAVKTLRDEHCRRNKSDFLREASVMIRLKHHCIVQLIGISKAQTLMMVQEMVPLGSMLQYIIENAANINPNYELKIWAAQIACGMNYLESQHFVHRDLAARNILLASRNQAKISDFGLSRAMGTDKDCYQATQGGKWPIKWYAPESYNNGYFSHASDVWSFGVTLWEMFSLGKAPYGDIRGVDAIRLIENGERLERPAKCPENVYKIMENCWNYKPKDRPTFRYLTEFFSNDPDYQNLIELIKTEHIS